MDWSIGNLIWIVIGGAIVGVLGRLVLPGKQNIPWWSVIIAGIVGMLAGDWLAGLIGVIARLLLPGRQSIPWWSVIVAGIVGMLVGDLIAGLLGVKETGGFDWIRHGLQLLVGVGAVAAAAALLGRDTSST